MTTQQQSTFENDNIKINMRREPGCRVFLDVSVSPKATSASYDRAIDSVRKEISIPGFRKGKVPTDYVLKNYNKHIEQEWKEILLNTSLSECLKLTKIYPFNQKSVHAATIKNASKTEGSQLTYEYEAMPDIPTINPKDLTLTPVPLRQVREQDVDDAVKDLTLQSGEWTDVTDRAAKDGDYVVIDIDDISEMGGNICTDTLFQMVKGQMGDWMIHLLTGLTPGQHAEGMSEKDKHPDDCKECKDGTHTHDDSFKPTMCRITLNKIRHVTPHPVDDDLAKKYGAPNAQELLTRVKQSLERKALEEQKDHERRNVELMLLQNYAFDIPSSLIVNELKQAKQAIQHDLMQRGVSEAEKAEQAKKMEDELAQRYLRDYILYFLTQKYAKEHRIQVNQEELMMEYMRQLWLEKMGANSVNLQANDEERKAQLQMQMLAMKALDSISQEANKA